MNGSSERCQDELAAAALAVARFIGGSKDRLGRPDPDASEEMREARERVRTLARQFGVQGGHETYLDQCAAVLRAAVERAAIAIKS